MDTNKVSSPPHPSLRDPFTQKERQCRQEWSANAAEKEGFALGEQGTHARQTAKARNSFAADTTVLCGATPREYAGPAVRTRNDPPAAMMTLYEILHERHINDAAAV